MALACAAGMLTTPAAEADRLLTLRGAERAIDLAFTAELAGDYDGARKALRAKIDAATRPEEEPGRARLRQWLIGQVRRQRAFDEHGKTAAGYWRAFQTLQGNGRARAELLWKRALRDVPDLRGDFEEIARVDVRFERVVGVDALRDWETHLKGLMGRHGLRAPEKKARARYEARISLDAGQASELMNRWRVTVESDYLLRDRHDEGRLVGSFTKRRQVVRNSEAHARHFGVRRVLDDLGWALVHQIREDVLRDLALP